MSRSGKPLVSCLCVSRNSLSIMQRAIHCFLQQTYPNKEMVLLRHTDNLEDVDYLRTLDPKSFKTKIVSQSSPETLGDLRNMSIEMADGEFFCIWDDDDWSHERRIEAQVTAAQNNYHDVCLLTNVLLFDSVGHGAYFSKVRFWEGTLLCRKEVVNETIKYPPIVKGEDSSLVEKIVIHSRLFPLVAPNLYIYVFHGNNTWNFEHFNYFVKDAVPLSGIWSNKIKDILDGKHDCKEGSRILESSDFLKQINYFYADKLSYNRSPNQ